MPDANAKKAGALRALLLCKTVEEAAKMSGVYKPTDPEQALALLATQGFLLIDSLPFAEKYPAGQRNTKLFAQLVKSSIPYFEGKIRNPLIDWSDNVKVALAFKIHGRTLTQALPKGLDLPTGQKCSLSYDLICADGSGYTSPKLLRSAFGIGVR